jgi:hypothetical protein
MSRTVLLVLLLATNVVLADDAPKAKSAAPAAEAKPQAKGDAKEVSGMSVLGNQEAPKALVIVPWTRNRASLISTMLDDSGSKSTRTCSRRR